MYLSKKSYIELKIEKDCDKYMVYCFFENFYYFMRNHDLLPSSDYSIYLKFTLNAKIFFINSFGHTGSKMGKDFYRKLSEKYR